MKKSAPEKGRYGYRDYRKKKEALKILAGLCLIFLQLGARKWAGQEAFKNILTVMAVVTVLPVANIAAPFLASFRYRTCGAAFYQELSLFEKDMAVLYDLLLTSKESVMPMDGAAVHPLGVFFYCSNPKLHTVKAEAFFKELFRSHRLDLTAGIFTDEKAFFQKLASLQPAGAYEDDGSVDYTVRLLQNISM